MEFLLVALPKRTACFPPITKEQWRRAVAKKNKYAAIGPDGVSKPDMHSKPDTALDDLLALVSHIEQGSENGVVCTC